MPIDSSAWMSQRYPNHKTDFMISPLPVWPSSGVSCFEEWNPPSIQLNQRVIFFPFLPFFPFFSAVQPRWPFI